MILILLAFLLLGSTCEIHAQTAFYQGKTITIIVSTKAGDVYDLYPRLVAEFMPKYIPGNPNIIIQNVAGAAGLIGTNQLYNTAKADGLTFGATYPALYFEQLAKRPEVKFDWTKFIWIGSTVSSNSLMYMRADTPYKTIEDVRAASTPPKCGATGVTSSAYYMPKLLEDAIGTKFDIVSGYVAGQDIDLAVERGEVVCRAFTVNAYFAREPFITWRKKNFVRVLYQTGGKRDPRLKDVPLFNELTEKYKTAESVRRLAKVILAADEFGRPLVFPPGVPADRVKIIRDAFNKTIHDPALLAEAERRRLDIDPSTGEELDALAKEVMTATPDTVEKVKKLIGK
ncbi:MAG TPA: tripartite tricarboxylate transporter substrate-binding protein [Candidatus Binatia bacterium]|jgi:tripartite-type tricarboxylate transporter receptor subunit TctC|nr:tripartite tricarboxylate transporter substrate-binding protein [Candidatus Binatia bacterium]